MAGAGQAAATPGRMPPSSAPREGMRRPRAGFWPGAVEALQGFRVRPPNPVSTDTQELADGTTPASAPACMRGGGTVGKPGARASV